MLGDGVLLAPPFKKKKVLLAPKHHNMYKCFALFVLTQYLIHQLINLKTALRLTPHRISSFAC
jgi:hypothetical protein